MSAAHYKNELVEGQMFLTSIGRKNIFACSPMFDTVYS